MTAKHTAAKLATFLMFAGASLAATSAGALPLTESACQRYQSERLMLARLGVREHLRNGPDWAQANLTQPQLDLIHRYIRIEEALEFRCPEQFDALPDQPADARRRLDVTPPVPGQKPPAEKPSSRATEAGVAPNELPPPPAQGPKQQG